MMQVHDPVVTLAVDGGDGAARATTITTPRGTLSTPCFMPVGTRGTVRALSVEDLDDLGAQVVLGNTYHLMLRPGVDIIERLGGLHGFMGLAGTNLQVLTDSGGYQVFSLGPDVDDDGVTFRSTYDGTLHRLTPELAVEVQARLGADIQMVLDVCPPLPSTPAVVRTAVERTAAWASRAAEAHRRRREAGSRQALFGIVQGGVDPALRAESAQRTVDVGFDGYGIGGLSVGEARSEMVPALSAAIAGLPPAAPRYLMGVGDPRGIIEAVALGVDLFDSVLPTRMGRHGTAFTSAGRVNLRNRQWAEDAGPLDPECSCLVCARYSRALLRHLLLVGEPTCRRLVALHNVHWTLRLVEELRAAVLSGTFEEVRRRRAAPWP
jgi:queuine tRNA-ribosyltransferase